MVRAITDGRRAGAWWLGLAVCASIATACGDNPVTPSPSGDLLVGLRLEPSTPTVKVGGTRQFTLLGAYYDGSTRPVAAQGWTATPNGMAVIDSQGTLTAIRMGIVTVSAAFEDKRAALVLSVTDEDESAPRTDLSGAWIGRAEVETCLRVSGASRNPCAIGIQQAFTLNLTQSGYSLTGSLRLGEGEGPVQGWRDPVGRMFLAGTLTGPSPGHRTLELTGWDTIFISPDRLMSGTFEGVERFDNAFGPQVLRSSFRLVEVSR